MNSDQGPGVRRAGRHVVSVVLTLALCTLAACGDDASSGETDSGATETAAGDGGSAEQWCADMKVGKAALREQYPDAFNATPDGAASPSSILLSVDGSPEAVKSLRDYVAGLADAEPSEIQGSSAALVAQLDEILADLEASPDQPGAAFTGALGAVGVFSVVDVFAVENCGETF